MPQERSAAIDESAREHRHRQWSAIEKGSRNLLGDRASNGARPGAITATTIIGRTAEPGYGALNDALGAGQRGGSRQERRARRGSQKGRFYNHGKGEAAGHRVLCG